MERPASPTPATALGAVAVAVLPWALGWAAALPPGDASPAYDSTERALLSALGAALVLAASRPAASVRGAMGIGALAGALLFVALAGVRIVVPVEAGWLMRGDWAWHFGGWHVFRSEPWRFPPGRLEHLMFPDGTSIGLTDAIPLLALPLKLAGPLLPWPMQYLGAWLALSFVLLGAWAARLTRTGTSAPRPLALAALLTVSLPVLVGRVGHVALTAHWLLVAGLTWHVERDDAPRAGWGRWLWLGAVASAVHPYLAAMVAALAAAWLAREAIVERRRPGAVAARGLALGATMALVLWLCGDFVVGGEALAAGGVGEFSMDLLAPVNGAGWSALFDGWPTSTPGQSYEGHAYPGAGLLMLVALAAALVAWQPPRRHDVRRLAPLAVTCAALALVAVGPVAFAGGRPLWRFDALADSPLVAAFRANGRFIWPAEYAVVLGAVVAVCTRLRPRAATALLAAALALQVVDLHAVWQRNYRGTRANAAFFAWASPLQAPAWQHVGAVFARVALVPAPECGPTPAPLEAFVRLAGDQAVALNSGTAARIDRTRTRARCAEIARQVETTALDPRTLYVVHPDRLGRLAETPTVTCVQVDGLHACGEARQMRRWLD